MNKTVLIVIYIAIAIVAFFVIRKIIAINKTIALTK